MAIDELDLKIIERLMRQGRTTWAEIAVMLGLSSPAAGDRVRRLEERGVIRGYVALVDPEALGCDWIALVAVTLERPEHREPFLLKVRALPEVQECYRVAGDDDYILKVRCRNAQDLDRVVSDELRSLAGVSRTRSTIVLATEKETTALPLGLKAP